VCDAAPGHGSGGGASRRAAASMASLIRSFNQFTGCGCVARNAFQSASLSGT
jgi:hypothetical protein